MLKSAMLSVTLTLGLVVLAQGQLPPNHPASNPNVTTIVVKEMHCASCAKKMGRHLQEVPGVAQVHFDVKSKTLWVTPGQTLPAPRALWAAIELAEDEPVRMQGPQGVYTRKP